MDSEATSSRNLEIGDIHVGMMLFWPIGKKMLGWVVDDTPNDYRLPVDLVRYRVEWANGYVVEETKNNILLYHRRWLEMEKSHERTPNKD